MTTIIGAFYGNAGKARGAEAGGEILFNSLKKYHNTISEECQLIFPYKEICIVSQDI